MQYPNIVLTNTEQDTNKQFLTAASIGKRCIQHHSQENINTALLIKFISGILLNNFMVCNYYSFHVELGS